MDATTGKERKQWLVALALGVSVGCCLVAVVMKDRGEPPIPPPPPRASVAPSETAPETTAPPPLAHATANTEGLPTRVVGADPTSVLAAYCEAARSSDPCDPIGIQEAPSPQRGVRLGVIRRRMDSAREYAIWIRMDPRTGKWFVGNGQTPVTPQPLLNTPH